MIEYGLLLSKCMLRWLRSGPGTKPTTSALQRFSPVSEGQLTFGGRDHEDRS